MLMVDEDIFFSILSYIAILLLVDDFIVDAHVAHGGC